MAAKWLKEYFSFTKKERAGIVTLLFLMIVVWFLPDILPKKKDFDPKTFEALEKAAFAAWRPDSSRAESGKDSVSKPILVANALSPPFYFDPNTISPEGWKRLGLPDRTIHTVQNYLAHGGKFRRPQDLGKIYGLNKEFSEKLISFVRIKSFDTAGSFKPGLPNQFLDRKIPERKVEKSFDIDINTADTSAWIALPGIGSKLASRIVSFREKLGGFYSVAQVAETFGLPDSVYQALRKFFHCDATELKKIDLNSATPDDLKNHPYLRRALGNAIYQYRLQHGNFSGLDELRKITLITEDVFTKIAPYLTVH